MNKAESNKLKLPDAPGVYFFLGARREILYIGRATSLKNRVRSYFASDIAEKRSGLIEKMVIESKKIEWTATDSVLEAMILETNLIRTHKPHYNTISKDDKSYNHLIITNDEWPRVLVVRGKDLTEKFGEGEIAYHFGPFPSAQLFKDALKIIRKLFRFYDTKHPVGSENSKLERGKIDFNRQIGLYPGETTKLQYQQTIRHIRLFFSGKKAQVINELERNMKKCAKAERFEEAQVLKQKIFALKHIQDIALIKNNSRTYRDENNLRIEAYDVAHHQGDSMVGVMTVLEGGEPVKSDYRKFKIASVASSNDTAALQEILERRLTHDEWSLPQLLVVDGGVAQKNVALRVLRKFALSIPVVGVVKDVHHKPVRVIGETTLRKKHNDAILLANAEAHRFAIGYHRQKQRKRNIL